MNPRDPRAPTLSDRIGRRKAEPSIALLDFVDDLSTQVQRMGAARLLYDGAVGLFDELRELLDAYRRDGVVSEQDLQELRDRGWWPPDPWKAAEPQRGHGAATAHNLGKFAAYLILFYRRLKDGMPEELAYKLTRELQRELLAPPEPFIVGIEDDRPALIARDWMEVERGLGAIARGGDAAGLAKALAKLATTITEGQGVRDTLGELGKATEEEFQGAAEAYARSWTSWKEGENDPPSTRSEPGFEGSAEHVAEKLAKLREVAERL